MILSLIGFLMCSNVYAGTSLSDKYKERVHKTKIFLGRNPFKATQPKWPELPEAEAKLRKEKFLREKHNKWNTGSSSVPLPEKHPISKSPTLPPIRPVSPLVVPMPK